MQKNNYRSDRGMPIFTSNIPAVYWEWFKDIVSKHDYVTMEISQGIILVVRTRVVVDDESAITGVQYAKFIKDSSGCFIEKTYMPKYFPSEDVVRSP